MPDKQFNAAGLGWSDGVLLLLLLSLEKNSGVVSMSAALGNTASTPGAIVPGEILESCCIISSLVGPALELYWRAPICVFHGETEFSWGGDASSRLVIPRKIGQREPQGT